jgi:hypothetical protein
MRMIVLGAIVALGTGLTGVLGASATSMTAAAIDEAAGTVSLITKTISCKNVPGECSHRRRHHHHYTATAPSTRQGAGKAQQTTSPPQGGSKGY